MKGKILIALFLVSSISLLVPVPAYAQIFCGWLQAFYLPGFAVVLLLWREEKPWFDYLFIPLLLSPIILSLLVVLLNTLTGSFESAVRTSAGIPYILLVVSLVAGKVDFKTRPSEIPPTVIIISAVFAGIIALSYGLNDFLLIRSDAWYHASLTKGILTRGLPPGESLLGGLPVRYMWFYHNFLACWKILSGLPLFHAMGVFNIASAFTLPYLIARLTSFFTNRTSWILTAPIFAVAGLESASWVLKPLIFVRALFGEVRGMDEIRRIVDNITIEGTGVIHFFAPPGTWMVNLVDKYLTITAFSYSLNLFILCFLFVLAMKRSGKQGVSAFCILTLAILGCFLFHMVTGIALIFTVICSSILMILYERLRRGQKITGRSLIIPGSAILATVCAFPYFHALNAGGTAGGSAIAFIGVSILNITTIAFPLLVLFVPAWKALKFIFSFQSESFQTIKFWIGSLLILCLSIDLPYRNESKLIFPLFLLLGPPIFWQIIETLKNTRGTRRVLITICVAVLFFIPPILTVRGFIRAKPTKPAEVRRYYYTEEDRRFIEWVEAETEVDAIFVENNEYNLLPVYAGRMNLYTYTGLIHSIGYDQATIQRYREIQTDIYTGHELQQETIETLAMVGDHIYIVVWDEDLIDNPALEHKLLSHREWFRKVFDSPAVKLYLLINASEKQDPTA